LSSNFHSASFFLKKGENIPVWLRLPFTLQPTQSMKAKSMAGKICQARKKGWSRQQEAHDPPKPAKAKILIKFSRSFFEKLFSSFFPFQFHRKSWWHYLDPCLILFYLHFFLVPLYWLCIVLSLTNSQFQLHERGTKDGKFGPLVPSLGSSNK